MWSLLVVVIVLREAHASCLQTEVLPQQSEIALLEVVALDPRYSVKTLRDNVWLCAVATSLSSLQRLSNNGMDAVVGVSSAESFEDEICLLGKDLTNVQLTPLPHLPKIASMSDIQYKRNFYSKLQFQKVILAFSLIHYTRILFVDADIVAHWPPPEYILQGGLLRALSGSLLTEVGRQTQNEFVGKSGGNVPFNGGLWFVRPSQSLRDTYLHVLSHYACNRSHGWTLTSSTSQQDNHAACRAAQFKGSFSYPAICFDQGSLAFLFLCLRHIPHISPLYDDAAFTQPAFLKRVFSHQAGKNKPWLWPQRHRAALSSQATNNKVYPRPRQFIWWIQLHALSNDPVWWLRGHANFFCQSLVNEIPYLNKTWANAIPTHVHY